MERPWCLTYEKNTFQSREETWINIWNYCETNCFLGSSHYSIPVWIGINHCNYICNNNNCCLLCVPDILKPQLIWRAGRAAEALRTAAVSCVVVGLPTLPVASVTHELTSVLVPLLLALIEDSAFRSRQYAARALYHIVEKLRENQQLNAENINTIFPGMLVIHCSTVHINI